MAAQPAALTPEAAAALQQELRRRELGESDISAHIEESSTERAPASLVPWFRFWPVLRVLGYALGHFLLAILGFPIATTYFFYVAKPMLGPFMSSESLAHNFPLTWPLFPLQASVCLLGGFLVARRRAAFWKHRVAEWVWVPPALWLMLNLLAYGQASGPEETHWYHFFWNGTYAVRRMQIHTTLPAVTSIAYALGHLLGRKTREPSVL